MTQAVPFDGLRRRKDLCLHPALRGSSAIAQPADERDLLIVREGVGEEEPRQAFVAKLRRGETLRSKPGEQRLLALGVRS